MGCKNSTNEKIKETEKDIYKSNGNHDIDINDKSIKLTGDDNENKETNAIIQNEIVAMHYVSMYGLDEHDIFDIEHSINFARLTWLKEIVDEEMGMSNDQMLLKLLTNLEINFNDEDINTLHNISSPNNNKLTQNLFIDWYIKHLYKDMEPISIINDNTSSTGNISIISDDSIDISMMSN